MVSRPYIRRATIVLGVLALLLPFIVWGAAGSMTRVKNAPAFWLPPSFQERQTFEDFSRRFNILDSILVSWDGCSVDDQRLAIFAEIVRQIRWEKGTEERQLFPEVLTGYEVLRQLTGEPINLPRSLALERLRGFLVGPDNSSSCAYVMLSPEAGQDREKTIGLLRQAASQAAGIPPEKVYLAGSVVDGAVVDRESVRVMTVYGLPAAIIAFGVAFLALRSWIQTLAVVAVATVVQAIVLAIVWYSGLMMNAVLAVMAPLVFVVTVSGGIHLSNYFKEHLRAQGPHQAVRAALQVGWWPCVVASVTTAIGTFSLVASQITPVRQFGVIASVGILISLVLLFTVLPGAMELRLFWITQQADRLSEKSSTLNRGKFSSGLRFSVFVTFLQRWQHGFWSLWGLLIVRRWGLLLVGCTAALAATAVGLPRLQTSVNVRNLLVPESPVLAHYRWLEEHIGPLVPVELVILFEKQCELEILQRLELIRAIEKEVRSVPEVGGVASPASFLPSIPEGGGARGTVRRAILRSRLESRLKDLARSHWVAEDDLGQWWRISARLPAFTETDYAVVLQHIEEKVDRVLATSGVVGVQVIPTGMTVLVEKAQYALLRGMFLSFLAAFLVVALVLAVVLGGIGLAAVAMIPNIFPSVLVFGVLGLRDIKVDIGTVMTASIALGIAVDGTVHYLTWFRRELESGRSVPDAVRRAFDHCGGALVQATLICIAGFLLFVGSSFLPMRRFATILAHLLIAALIGDLVLLPALLMSPVGEWLFMRKPVRVSAPVPRCAPIPLETVGK